MVHSLSGPGGGPCSETEEKETAHVYRREHPDLSRGTAGAGRRRAF